ncbi:GGDEF domain-containing protein [Hydrogenimonas urashimensis]|uniref:GGDEF domain-containing protein n=1 Tax=Hydrogenimonas urashimensis TaxID=2740515 RepID=UPI00191659FA|nr:diguanylate cyclase [Hydrogenimonas urashimensis]
MTVQEIIKESLREIKSRGLQLTPEVYGDIFCKHAKKANVILEECQKLDKFLKRLSPELQKSVKSRHVSSVDQLIQYLGSEVMRAGSSKSSEIIQAYVLLIKRLLQAVSMLHNRKAAEMAARDGKKIAAYLTKSEIDEIRDHWNRFVMEYDDSFLKKISPYCATETDDLETMVNGLAECLKSYSGGGGDFTIVAQILVAALAPSIASGMNDEIATISAQIRSNPELLTSQAMIEDVRYIIKKRIELDKKAVTTQMSEIDSIIEHINMALVRVIDCGENNYDAICKIQGELGDVNLKSDSFEVIHTKLRSIATSLETETRVLGDEMKKSREEIAELRQKVRILEEALRKERKKSGTDTLTKLPNRRAIDDFIKKQEATFKRYGDNYAVVLFDIDHFKAVNDNYGHDAGDVVLASFGKMLRRYSREVDFVGRWGGEEFLVVLPKTGREGAMRFAEKLRDVVSRSKFMYKGERIPITISGGVADRVSNASMEEMLKRADENLYQAKEGGRNKIAA